VEIAIDEAGTGTGPVLREQREMSETFLPSRDGSWINARFVQKIRDTKDGWVAIGTDEIANHSLTPSAELCFRPSTIVPGGQTAHVFTYDKTAPDNFFEYKTTVIAWRVWHGGIGDPVPISLDGTDITGTLDGDLLIVVENHGVFEEIGEIGGKFEDLTAARAEAKERGLRRRSSQQHAKG
jgi:hypothetical protein